MRSNRRGPVVDFTLVTNPIGPSNRARHAMRKVLKASGRRPDEHVRFLEGYLCKMLGVAPEQLILGHGSSHLLSIFLQAMRPRNVLMPSPAPPHYGKLFERYGIDVVQSPLKREAGFSLDSQRFKELWKDTEAALLPNPHDPTGTLLQKGQMLDLLDTSRCLGKTLIVDETLAEFVNVASPAQEAASGGHVLILRSFSFYYALAGLRIGYAVGNNGLIREMRTVIDPWPVNTVAAAAALASIRDKGYVRRTSEFLAAEQAYVAKRLAQLRGIDYYSLPWGYLIRFEPAIPDLTARLLDKGIIAEPFFDSENNQYVRFPFRSHRLNALFVRRLGWVLKEHEHARRQSTANP